MNPKPATKGALAGSWSIARRLIVLYTLSAAAILFLTTGFLYWVLTANLRDEDNQFLTDILETVTKILKEHPGEMQPLRVEVELEGPARRYAKYFARVIEPSGRILIQTPGMIEALPSPDAFPPPAGSVERFAGGVKWRSPAGKPFLLAAVKAEPGRGANGSWVIQMALDVANEEANLSEYRRWLVLVLFFGIIGSAAAGAGIARRGLRPLERITRAAQRITATQLNERITPAGWPAELTTLATEFDKMLGRLEESFNRLSQFSADLAHELRTPINNLMGEAEVALSRSRTPEEYRQVLESSLEEYARLSRMIDSLLFLARAENAETKIQKSLFDAMREIHSVSEFYEALGAEKGVSVATPQPASVSPKSVALKADVILFRRALGNLLSNALHYTARGGAVTVSARQLDNQWVELRVSDTGCGIAPEHLPRIFNRFYRVDPSRSQHPEGMGLGLAIVKSIMDMHGGNVTVQSELGKGTTVSLRFPTESVNYQI